MDVKRSFLLLIFSLFIAQLSLSQETTEVLSLKPGVLTIDDIMKEVNQQANIRFSFVDNAFDPQQEVKIEKENYRLNELLDLTFKDNGIKWLRKGNLIIISAPKANSKKKVIINGYLKDDQTHEALIGAHVVDVSTNTGVTSNVYGYFSISTERFPQSITFSYLGYAPKTYKFFVRSDTTISIFLSADAQQLEEVVVGGDLPVYEKTGISSISLQSESIKTIPTLLGEADVLKAIQLLPGVQAGTEGSSGIYVRGGGPDQNLVLLDGVPVYNVNHLFGFFSVFNADAIRNVDLIKGGFPARYGGRLSSVIDISMKEGNANSFQGEGSVGTLATKLTFEGPVGKSGNTSFLISGRRTYLDALVVPIARMTNSNRLTTYNFWDLNAKINHTFSRKNRVFFSIYSGRDRLRDEFSNTIESTVRREDINELSGIHWGNITTAIRWNHIYSPQLFGNVTATFSRYKFNFVTEIDNDFTTNGVVENVFERNDYFSSIRDLALKTDFDYAPSNKHRIRFGAALIEHTFEPGVSRFRSQVGTDTTFGASQVSTLEFSSYIEDKILVSKKLSANVGLHIAGNKTQNTFYSSLQPRLALNYLLGPKLSFKFAYDRTAQFLHLLVNTGVGLPTDLWVPTTDDVRPGSADQLSLGLASVLSEQIEVTVEGYYKWMNNLIEYQDGAGFLNVDDNFQDIIESGKGTGYGIEFLLRKKRGKTSGWLGYTWSRSFRDFDNLNSGNRFPYRFDRPHDVNLTLNHQWKPHITVAMVWVYGTGYPITLPNATFPFSSGHITGRSEIEFGENYPNRNGSRIKDFHRLDLSISFSKENKWGERKWVFGLYNAYSRLNPVFVDFNEDTREFRQTSLFPVVPFISYQFRF